MGAILNTLPLNETQSLENISSNRADWLTAHADATGLAVVEVERLWNRFRQLTGSKDQTKLYLNATAVPNEIANDVFVRNFFHHFPRSKTGDDSIPFGYFILAMQFLDNATIEKKLSAIFLYLNNGEPITAMMISKLLRHVYPETKDDEVKNFANQFMRQLGSNEQGAVNQQQFITGVQRAIPPPELEELLHFDIIPAHLLEEANRLPSLQSSSTNLRQPATYANDDLVSDNQLRQVANEASKRNWTKLALDLDFLEYDIESYKVQNNYDAVSTLFELLRTWREQQGLLATKNRLKAILRQSDMEDLTSILN